MNVQPSTAYEAVINTGTGAQTGLLGMRVNTNLGVTHTAFSTATILEIAAGVYAARGRTSPGTAGQYTIIWTLGDLGAVVGIEELTVTSTAPVVVSASNMYVTRDQVKDALSITQTVFDEGIDRAIASASRAIDQLTYRRFYPTVETRYYTPDPRLFWAPIDDVVTVTALEIDTGGNGSYGTAWTEGSEYHLSPANAPLVGEPFTRLDLRLGQLFPYNVQRGVRIAGTFGWAETPPGISQFTEILVAKLMRRSKDAPFGFLQHGTEGTATRLARTDPDFDTLVSPYIRSIPFR
jgi:hypothetical protein